MRTATIQIECGATPVLGSISDQSVDDQIGQSVSSRRQSVNRDTFVCHKKQLFDILETESLRSRLQRRQKTRKTQTGQPDRVRWL